MNLGGIPKSLDLRDIHLGSVQAPVEIPASYETDISWLDPIWQSDTPACGAHAWAHLKAILDFVFEGVKRKYAPRYSWLEIKQIDGHPLEVGTDMRSIFKAGANRGASDYELLPNVFPTTVEEYSDQRQLTGKLRENAHPRIIKAYGFGTPARVEEHIYQNKAVLLLLDVGDTWWGHKYVFPFRRRDSGHFVVAYGYNRDGWIKIIDSADKKNPLKELSPDYPIREVGTAIDMPDEDVRRMIADRENLQRYLEALRGLWNAVRGRNIRLPHIPSLPKPSYI